uniref:Solute carrier family 22 member 15 (inferred by orthology to a human protein) n=1 Tax=Strongyloides venezuelensis TaxID=75913 RepID=A0A0K0F4L3_STRVS
MVTTTNKSWFPDWVNPFNILVFALWQSQNFMSVQMIFPIFSNYVSKWRCDGVGDFGKNCTIYNSGCQIEYENNYFKSAAVSFGWICSDTSYLMAFSSQLQFFGVLIGTSVSGFFSDAFGRRNTAMLNLGTGCLFILASSFIKNPYFFVGSRFLIGLANGGTITSSVTYCMEVLPSDKRIFVKLLFNWGLSRFILTTICYFFNDYNSALFVCGLLIVPAVMLLIFYFPESPTWYHYKNREEKMIESEKRIAKLSHLEYVPIQHDLITKKDSFYEVLKNKEIFKRLSVFWFMWFVTALSSYGIDLHSNEISGNLFINQYFFAFPIFFSKLLVPTIDNKFKWFTRRLLHQGSQTLIVMCFGILVFLVATKYNGLAILILNVIGIVFIEFSWDACFVCTVESVPTNVRSSVLGSCSLMARVGSIISPMLSYVNVFWSPMIYLIVAVLGSLNLLISFLFLKETKNILLDRVHLTDDSNDMRIASIELLSKEVKNVNENV